MSDQRIPISQLSETQTAPDASYIAIDDGSLTKKITVENFNSTSTASAQQYANQAAASAQTVEDNIATSAAQIREATLAAREATQASTAASASATSAYDSASLAQNYSANASTSAGQAMNAADSAAQNLTASKGYAEDSEAWAVGKRNGSDVPASDETYQNNAKYYADSASGSATRAEAAAQSITVPDTTLTVSGVAAESKATGNRISSVNAELVDIRVKANGTTAATAGDAVREQITELKNDLNEETSDLKSAFNQSENLIPIPYSGESGSVAGVSITVNDDGSITLNGTSTGAGSFLLLSSSANYKVPAGTYTFSGCSGGGRNTYRLYAAIRGSGGTDIADFNNYTTPVTKTTTAEGFLRVNFTISASGVVFDNFTVKPMFNNGNIALPYQPRKEANVVLAAAIDELAGDVGALERALTSLSGDVDTLEGSLNNLSIVQDYDTLLESTTDYVYVENNNSPMGDGGPCLFCTRTGEIHGGYERNNGTYVFPLPNQGNMPAPNAPRDDLLACIKTWVGESSLVYGNNKTLYSTTCGNEIDCSSFVTAVINGVRYEKSRYVLGTAEKNVIGLDVGDTLMKWISNAVGWGRLLTFEMAAWFAQRKRLFKVPSESAQALQALKFGDLLFSGTGNDDNADRYFGIGHVLFVLGTVPDRGVVVVAQGGGAGASLIGNNESTVCKTSYVTLSAATISSYYKVFARPNYGKGVTKNSSLINVAINNTYYFDCNFTLNTIIDSTTGNRAESATWASTEDYYEVLPGRTITFTGEATDSDGNVGYTAGCAEYDKDYKFVKYKNITNGADTLANNTKYVRFVFGHSLSQNTKMTLAKIDDFSAKMT